MHSSTHKKTMMTKRYVSNPDTIGFSIYTYGDTDAWIQFELSTEHKKLMGTLRYKHFFTWCALIQSIDNNKYL